MGVVGLWSVLEGVASNTGGGSTPAAGASPIVSLSLAAAAPAPDTNASTGITRPPSSPFTNGILAVDLSVWLMESQSIARTFESGGGGAAGPNSGYHLQYIFQRTCAFLRQSIGLIFVSDGRAPILKNRLTSKWNQVGPSSSGLNEPPPQSHKRNLNSLYASQIEECSQLFQLMNIPLLKLIKGEAEALCGILNFRRLCSGVLTPDGDCLLFGGRTILKNVKASQTMVSARMVNMKDIETTFELDRYQLIILALFVGSDYTSGVRSLGPRKSLKLLKIMRKCKEKFQLQRRQQKREEEEDEEWIIRFFEQIIDTPTPEEAIQLIYDFHPDLQQPYHRSSSASSSASFAPPPATSSSSSSPLIDYSLLSLTDLKVEMSKHGLKPQTKAVMIAKLHQIQMLSPTSAAISCVSLRASSPTPAAAAATRPTSQLLSDSDEDEYEDQHAPPKRKHATKKPLRRVSVDSFLLTYFTKVHSRYHPPQNRKEMQHIIDSYLHPIFEPTFEQHEEYLQVFMNKKKKDHRIIPQPHDFLQLRSFCANEFKMSFVRFEKQWIPILTHLELWRRSNNVTAPSSYTSPNLTAAAAAAAASSSSSSASSDTPLYTLSHISKRRIIHGVPHFTLIHRKTERGRKEIAYVPKSMMTPAAVAAQAKDELNDGEEDEFDLTSPPQPLPSPQGSPLPASSPAIGGSKKSMPIQDVDLDLYETYEPCWFVLAACPSIVEQFELDERRAFEEKEAAKKVKLLEKRAATQAATAARKKNPILRLAAEVGLDGDSPLEENYVPKPKSKRGRPPKKHVTDSTPPITTFLSPIPTATYRPTSPIPRSARHTNDEHEDIVNDDDPVDLTTPSPPPKPISVASIAKVALDELTPSLLSAPLGQLPFRSSKHSSSLPPLVQPKLTTSIRPINSSPLTLAPVSSPSVTESIFATRVSAKIANATRNGWGQQSTLNGYVKSAKGTHISEEEPPPAIKKEKCHYDADEKSDDSQSPSPVVDVVAASSSHVSSSFSSTLSVCPLCSRAFVASIIVSHVNSCLDQQQLVADEELARDMSVPNVRRGDTSMVALKNPPIIEPDDDDDDDDDFDLDSEASEHGQLVLVPNGATSIPIPLPPMSSAFDVGVSSNLIDPPLRSSSRVASSASSPNKMTPTKRKRVTTICDASTTVATSNVPPVALADLVRPSSHRTLILVDSSDDDDDDDDCDVELLDEEDGDEPGSTIYSKKRKHSQTLAPARRHITPPRPVPSIFAKQQ